jgi:hypothetical protein
MPKEYQSIFPRDEGFFFLIVPRTWIVIFQHKNMYIISVD